MLLDDGLQATYQGVERLAGIFFLGPEGAADFRLRQQMRVCPPYCCNPVNRGILRWR